jgi:hypothetical protein
MEALKIIGWFLWLIVSIMAVFELIGFSGLTRMFPEGQRGWHFPAQLASLAFFAGAVLCNPWM